jgi:dihydrofolate reductase
MKIVLIAALSPDGTIGDKGRIPWHISADLKRFKRVTMGHPVIMGRKTFASIGQPLPGRRNIVLTRNATRPLPDGVERFADFRTAVRACGDEIIFVIGGAEVYREAIAQADTLLLTHVHKNIAGDTKFPQFDRTQWMEVSRQDTEECSFVEYTRKR